MSVRRTPVEHTLSELVVHDYPEIIGWFFLDFGTNTFANPDVLYNIASPGASVAITNSTSRLRLRVRGHFQAYSSSYDTGVVLLQFHLFKSTDFPGTAGTEPFAHGTGSSPATVLTTTGLTGATPLCSSMAVALLSFAGSSFVDDTIIMTLPKGLLAGTYKLYSVYRRACTVVTGESTNCRALVEVTAIDPN